MSNIGQGALTIVGTIVGSYFGYPQLGYALGSLAGQALFPTQLPTQRGPKLDDLSVQGSAVGVPIPIVYGTYRVAGNIIWSTDLIETTTTEEVGGKGGPTQKIETTTYSVNFAVGLCNNEITAIRRIWAGGKLIYDRRPQLDGEDNDTFAVRMGQAAAFDATMTVYLGTPDQLPDTTIESYEGLGNVPGFRDIAYVVFRNFQLADYGNNLSGTALSFEIVSGGALGFDSVYTVSPRVVFPWTANIVGPYNPQNNHSVNAYYSRNDSIGSPGEIQELDLGSAADAISAILTDTSVSGVGDLIAPTDWPEVIQLAAFASPTSDDVSNELATWGRTSATMSVPAPYTGILNVTQFHFPVAPTSGTDFYVYRSDDDGTITQKLSSLGKSVGTVVYLEGDTFPTIFKKFASTLGVSNVPIWQRYGAGSGQGPYIDSGGGVWYKCDAITVRGTRVPRAPDNPCNPQGLDPYPDADAFPGFCVIDGVYIEDADLWSEHTGQSDRVESKMLQRYNQRVGYPEQCEPILAIDDPNYNSETFWTAAYDQAVLDGLMPPDLVYQGGTGLDLGEAGHYPVYPTEQKYYDMTNDQSVIDPYSITLQQIVEDICRRSGMPAERVNATDLGVVDITGYAVGRVMDGVSSIQLLRPYGLFDAVESNGVLKFLRRGASVVATIDADDLCAHESSGDRPSAVAVTRTNDIELPRLLRLRYSMGEKDYEIGEQSASRLRTAANQVVDMELPIVMTDQRAAELADINLFEAWLNRNNYRISLSHEHLALEPTDSIVVPVDGELQRMRIVSEDLTIPGITQIEAVRDGDRAGYYTSYVSAGQPVAPGQQLRVLDDSIGFFFDLPALRDADDNAGYYIGMRQVNATGAWPGAAALRSADGGGTYTAVASAISQACTGILVDALDAGETSVIDYEQTVTVTLDRAAASLSSTTLLGLASGANAAAIGADGRWEIIQFLNAELTPSSADDNTWTLSGLLRGRRGSEHAMGSSLAGDQFVLLNALVRAPQDLASIGAPRLIRAITSGQALDAQDPVTFTGNGEALMPFSPAHLIGYRDGSGDCNITWIRRGRLGQELPDGADVPLSEESEAYDLEIYDGPDVVRTVTVVLPAYVYGSADQVSDFGSEQSAIAVKVYQISATVGRGHAAEATV